MFKPISLPNYAYLKTLSWAQICTPDYNGLTLVFSFNWQISVPTSAKVVKLESPEAAESSENIDQESSDNTEQETRDLTDTETECKVPDNLEPVPDNLEPVSDKLEPVSDNLDPISENTRPQS